MASFPEGFANLDDLQFRNGVPVPYHGSRSAVFMAL